MAIDTELTADEAKAPSVNRDARRRQRMFARKCELEDIAKKRTLTLAEITDWILASSVL
jgi:uncharacterized protein YpbB